MAGEDPRTLGDQAVRLARGAAELIRERDGRLRGGSAELDVHAKSTSTDLVTVVDKASEQWLVDELARERPGDAVLAEESGGHSGGTGVRWLLDPIDGTVNFVLGLPFYAVSVAAEVDGQVVAGAVCAPATGELYRATLGGGAWAEEGGRSRRLGERRSVPLDRAVVATGFNYDRQRRRLQAEVAARLLPRVADIRRIGSAALDLCQLAAGRLDGYYEVGLNPWDYGAGALVAREAGCLVSGLRGREPSPAMAAAAAPEVAESLFALLEELDADAV